MKINNIDVPYAQIPNTVLFDPNLSWKAKGIWAYIQAKPNDWDFASERMADDSTDGIKATRSGIDELIQSGYLLAKRLQSGRMVYSLTEKAKVTKSHNAVSALCQNVTSNKERVITKKENKEIASAEPNAPFSYEEEKEKLEDNKSRHLNIIALFMEYRKKTLKVNIQNKEQLSLFIARHSRSASQLAKAKYTDDQLVEAFDITKKKCVDIDWTLETIVKHLTK